MSRNEARLDEHGPQSWGDSEAIARRTAPKRAAPARRRGEAQRLVLGLKILSDNARPANVLASEDARFSTQQSHSTLRRDMELHYQCAPLARKAICGLQSRERRLPPAPLPRGTGAGTGGKDGRLACDSLPPHALHRRCGNSHRNLITTRQRSAARPAPALAF